MRELRIEGSQVMLQSILVVAAAPSLGLHTIWQGKFSGGYVRGYVPKSKARRLDRKPKVKGMSGETEHGDSFQMPNCVVYPPCHLHQSISFYQRLFRTSRVQYSTSLSLTDGTISSWWTLHHNLMKRRLL